MFNVSILGVHGDKVLTRDNDGNVPVEGDKPEQFAYPVFDYTGSEVTDADTWLSGGFQEWVSDAGRAVREVVSRLNKSRDPVDVQILNNLYDNISSSSYRQLGGRSWTQHGHRDFPPEQRYPTPYEARVKEIADLITEDINVNNGLPL